LPNELYLYENDDIDTTRSPLVISSSRTLPLWKWVLR